MTPLAAVAVAHAAAAAAFTLVSAASVLRYARRHAALPATGAAGERAKPRVVLLRPTERVDGAFATRIAGDSRAYSGPLSRVVCVPGPEAVRAPLAVAVAVASSGVATDAPVNRKVKHLEAGLALAAKRGWLAAGAVVVHADADVVLAPRDLDELVLALERDAPDGAAFAPPAPSGGAPFAELMAQSILAASPQAFAVVWSLARLTRSPPALAGKLVAMRAATLEALGGYAPLAASIADDLALVAALRARGGRVALAGVAARTVDRDRTAWRVVQQMVRWMRVVASHRPLLLVTYPLLVAPLAVAAVLAAACGMRGETSPAWALAALFVSRFVLASVLARGPYEGRVPSPLETILGALAGDAVLVAATLAALWPAPITWSGRRYDVGRSGRILGARPDAPPGVVAPSDRDADADRGASTNEAQPPGAAS